MRHNSERGTWQVTAKVMFPIFVLFIAVAAASSSSSALPKAKGELYAVVVGITKFQDQTIRKLTLSDKDARDFYAFLEERKHLFPKAHLSLLLNEQATRYNVTKALRDDLKAAGKDDYVLIYLSGHGAADPSRADEFYFITYDSKLDNLYSTAVWMNQQALFKGIDSDRVLLLSDACHSGGFSPGLEKAIAKEADAFFSMFEGLRGRFALSSSRADERSFELQKYGNSIFTHYVLKGLRGEAAHDSRDGMVTVKQLFEYVYHGVKDATEGKQSPQLYCLRGKADDTPVFRVPVYDAPLTVKVQFMWKDDDETVKPLTNESVLKSGQRVGCAFRPESDCYVYAFWWDSTGTVGRLFPNPQLTEGTAEARAGREYWIPTKGDGKHWYLLDKNAGDETFHFVASRKRNPRIESLYEKLRSMSEASRTGKKGQAVAQDLEGEIERLMGVEPHTVPDQPKQSLSSANRERLFEAMESEIKVSGAEAVYKVKFKHINP